MQGIVQSPPDRINPFGPINPINPVGTSGAANDSLVHVEVLEVHIVIEVVPRHAALYTLQTPLQGFRASGLGFRVQGV